MSFILYICIGIAFWVYGKELYYKENPNTTISELVTNSP